MNGFGRILQEIKQAPKALAEMTREGQKASRAAANAGAAWATAGTRATRPGSAIAPAGGAAKRQPSMVARALTSFGGVGARFGAAANAPTAGLAGVGVAAAAAGLAIRQWTLVGSEYARQAAANARAIAAATATILGAVKSENSGALAATLADRTNLVGGRSGTPEVRAFFKKADDIEAQTKKAQLARALKFGEEEMRSGLARVISPETAALRELKIAADKNVALQEKSLRDTNWLGKLYILMSNTAQGKAYKVDIHDAERERDALASNEVMAP